MRVVMYSVNAYLRETWKAVPAFADVHLIFDGIGVSGAGSSDLLMLGDDGDPDTEVSSEWSQNYVDLAQSRKQETGVIPCAIISQTGDTYQPSAEKRAFELLALAVTPLETDRTMGGLVFTCEIATGTKRTIVNSQGLAIIAPFDIAYWASA